MSNIRIITGSAKGRKLEVPEKGTRPMTDRVKSSLFSIINPLILNANVLDLYAGSGALGIECLSRGAKQCVFIDKSKEAVSAIKNNLEKTGMTSLGTVIKCSVLRFLNEYQSFGLNLNKFNIVFFTPPHDRFKEKLIEPLASYLELNGVIAVEHPTRIKTKEKLGTLSKIDERQYGITTLSFYVIPHRIPTPSNNS